jgi:hypothetical protein
MTDCYLSRTQAVPIVESSLSDSYTPFKYVISPRDLPVMGNVDVFCDVVLKYTIKAK